jgi:soluble lytic murein transglycosylase-like protein
MPPESEPYREMIESASRITGVPASLLAAVIHDESRWNAGAGGATGDTGLMQVSDSVFAALQGLHPELAGMSNKNDPATNILAGAFFLADMKKDMASRYGIDDWGIALRGYNSGPNGVDPNNLSNLPAGTGTATYIDKVMKYWNIIETGGTLPP